MPSGGETTYVSVWCRVVRARSDGRVLAAVWPLYVLYSHLPLDTDVSTEHSTIFSYTRHQLNTLELFLIIIVTGACNDGNRDVCGSTPAAGGAAAAASAGDAGPRRLHALARARDHRCAAPTLFPIQVSYSRIDLQKV